MRIILASQSGFRKKALDILGLKYTTIPSNLDEKSITDKNPEKRAQKLAEAKALYIGKKQANSIIIAGDLFVVFKNKIYEKPKNKKEAFQMLKSFSNNKLEIVTSVAVYNSKTKKLLSAAQKCGVKFRKLFDYEIRDYISRYPVLKFAGAFDGEGLLRFSQRVEGKYAFLTGFPLDKLLLFLRKNKVKV